MCYTVGDMLLLSEVTLCLRLIHKAEKVDMCFVCNPESPTRFDRPEISSYNYNHHLNSLVPLVQVNPYLGSLFMFDSYEHLEKFVSDNIDRYHVWPPGNEYANKVMSYRRNWKFVEKFYNNNDFIPHLYCRPFIANWAKSFMKKHVFPHVAVTVQLRNNKRKKGESNAPIDQWVKFFNHCAERFPVKFVVICDYEEIDDRYRELSNVIVAKDFHTTVEQDMALIQAAAMFMGGSGPLVMAVFSDMPYLIIVKTMEGVPFPYAHGLQRIIFADQTAPLLIDEFSKLYSEIDVSGWSSKCEATAVTIPETLYLLGRSLKV